MSRQCETGKLAQLPEHSTKKHILQSDKHCPPYSMLQEAEDPTGQIPEPTVIGSGKQRRDSSPAQLAFSSQLPVSSQVLLLTSCICLCLWL